VDQRIDYDGLIGVGLWPDPEIARTVINTTTKAGCGALSPGGGLHCTRGSHGPGLGHVWVHPSGHADSREEDRLKLRDME
jgi:hypothetical protein